METVLENLPVVRFIRQARSAKFPLVATPAALNESIELLRAAPWRMTRTGLPVTMPPPDPTQTESSDSFDAYKFTGDCAPQSGVLASFVGMAAYRITIPQSAITAGAGLDSIRFWAYANKFLSAGLRLAAFFSGDETPDGFTWDELRGDGGDAATIQSLFNEPNAATAQATNKAENITLPVGKPCAMRYLWLIIQLEDWKEIKWEYWIEGAGFIDAATISATFGADGITHDPEDTAFAFPVTVKEFFEPSRVFPLRRAEMMLTEFFNSDNNHDRAFSINPLPERSDNIKSVVGEGIITFIWREDGTLGCYWADGHFVNNNHTTSTATSVDRYNEIIEWASSLSGVIDFQTNLILPVENWGGHFAVLLNNGKIQIRQQLIAGADQDMDVGLVEYVESLENVECFAFSQSVVNAVIDGFIWRISINTTTNKPSVFADATHRSKKIKKMRGFTGNMVNFVLYADGTAWKSNDSFVSELTGVNDIVSDFGINLLVMDDGTVFVADGGTDLKTTLESLTNVKSVTISGGYCAVVFKDGSVKFIRNSTGTVASEVGAIEAQNFGDVVFAKASDTIASPRTSWLIGRTSDVLCWRKIELQFDATHIPNLWDSNAVRDNRIRQMVRAGNLVETTLRDNGAYSVNQNGLSASAIRLEFQRRKTDASPNLFHYSMPSRSGGDGLERYIRIIVMLDTNRSRTSPIETLEGWKTVWSGGAPEGYQVIGSEYLRHTGFVNSRFMRISSVPEDGVLWFIVMPMHMELDGDSTAFDIDGGGWDAKTFFLYRDK